MKRLEVSIEDVQHVHSMQFALDLTQPGLMCLVGRNGVGKTTLVRALRNMSNADTFMKTAPPRIVRQGSKITYTVDGHQIVFTYDKGLRSLNCRQPIAESVRNAISVELPIPHGARFSFAKSAAAADDEIRRRLALNEAATPTELIDFLRAIYGTGQYAAMIEVEVKNQKFYAIANQNKTYIREDYLSSGEHFLINLYRAIKSKAKLIVIDEIELSLDAAAQARLAEYLRSFCTRYQCTILFTTHSLAIMRTLQPSELLYLDNNGGNTTATPASYSYAKARLFGFEGWDRYILTEDSVLASFLEFLLAHKCPPFFFSSKVIYVGGGTQVVDLLTRNRVDAFLARPEAVIAVLDGDERGKKHASAAGVHLTPLDHLEKALFELSQADPNFPFKYKPKQFTGAKDFYAYLQQTRAATLSQIHNYLFEHHEAALQPLVDTLTAFLACPKPADIAE